jgi:hypothetical protein
MTETLHILYILDQCEVFLSFIHHSYRLLMTTFSEIEDMISLLDQFSRFSVDLLDERTGGITPSHFFLSELLEVARSCSMCRYDDEASLGYLLEIRLEYDSPLLEHAHNKRIMNNLMIHIDRCRMSRHYLHEHADRAVDSGAVATRICGID